MTETVEEQKAEQFDVRSFFDLVRRRHMHFLIPLLLGWLAVWGMSWILPARYKSNTLILVEQPTMPKNYVLPNVNDDLQARLQTMTQQILSRTRLLMIINKLHLYTGKDSPGSEDDRVAAMRKDIDVELVRDTAHNQEVTAFRIFYSSRNPYVAQQVDTELTNLFISENQKVYDQESKGTTAFLGDQLDVARQSLAQQEAKVKQFEALHEGELPSQQTSNLQILSGLQQQLQNEQDGLNTAKQQAVYYQSMLDEYRTLHGTGHGGGDPALAGLPALDQQISNLKGQLAELRSRYTDEYPDVVKVKGQLATAQRNRADLITQIRQNAAENKSTDADANEPLDPTQSATLLQLQGQVRSNKAEIVNREHAIQQLQGRIGEYSGRLNAEPAIEQQMADLTRGYNQSQAIYDDLLKKKTDSSMATSMEELQQGERFTILDAAILPTKPAFPNRLKFCGFGLAAGFGLGILCVVAFEFFDDRLYDEKKMKGILPFAVISEVPEIRDAAAEARMKRSARLGWATAVVAVTTILAGSVFSIFLG